MLEAALYQGALKLNFVIVKREHFLQHISDNHLFRVRDRPKYSQCLAHNMPHSLQFVLCGVHAPLRRFVKFRILLKEIK